MEIIIDVWTEDTQSRVKTKCNEAAIYTFVNSGNMNKLTTVPEVIPETKKEKERFDSTHQKKTIIFNIR